MKTFALTSIVALATVATAQLSNIPSCALNCFIGPLTTNGCGGLTDFACHCKQGAQLLGTVQPCVQAACKADEQATTIAAVEKTCQEAGVPIEIPEGTSAAGSAVASATSAAASGVASLTSAGASGIASLTSAAAEATSSAAEEVSSAVESAASSIASLISSATHAATASSNGTATATSSSLSEFTGAATQATQAAGLLGAAALALLAL